MIKLPSCRKKLMGVDFQPIILVKNEKPRKRQNKAINNENTNLTFIEGNNENTTTPYEIIDVHY